MDRSSSQTQTPVHSSPDRGRSEGTPRSATAGHGEEKSKARKCFYWGKGNMGKPGEAERQRKEKMNSRWEVRKFVDKDMKGPVSHGRGKQTSKASATIESEGGWVHTYPGTGSVWGPGERRRNKRQVMRRVTGGEIAGFVCVENSVKHSGVTCLCR